MRRFILQYSLIFFLSVIPVFTAFSDDPDGPPNPGGDPGVGGGQPVGAPIDGGTAILLILGASYSGYKIRQTLKRQQAGDEVS